MAWIQRKAAAAALMATLGLAACTHGAAGPASRARALIGQPLRLAAQSPSGVAVDVGAAQGRVRVVDFWATWCEPCRESLPLLDRMAAELGPRGLLVYAVSFDEDDALLAAFLKEVPLALPVLIDRGGDQLASRFEVSRLPTTLVVDRRGVIRYVHEGWSMDRAREERREVERLLAEPE